MGLRCVINRIPDVVVMKMHDRVIGSRTGLRMMMFGAGVLAVLLGAFAGAASAKVWTVNDDGGADFASIQAVRLTDNHVQKGLYPTIASRPIDRQQV